MKKPLLKKIYILHVRDHLIGEKNWDNVKYCSKKFRSNKNLK